jgi:hypothetical protein
MIRALFIDPARLVIEPIDLAPGLAAIYQALDCRTIDAVRFHDTSDIIYVDDEALISGEPLQWFWQVAGGPIIHAKGLVVGTTPDGDDADATWPLEDLHAQLRWLRIPIGFPPGLMIDLTANCLVSVKDASTQVF